MSDTSKDPTEDPAVQTLLAEFRGKNPGHVVKPLAWSGGVMIVKSPSDTVYGIFRATTAVDMSKNFEASRSLCYACILSPSGGEVITIFERKPVLVDRIASVLVDMAGGDEEIRLGK